MVIVLYFCQDGHVSGTTDTMIVVGAASKGIIQRDHQHNAVVYKQYYAPNPFDNMSEDEVEKYKQDIANKARGGPHTGQTGGTHGGMKCLQLICPWEIWMGF